MSTKAKAQTEIGAKAMTSPTSTSSDELKPASSQPIDEHGVSIETVFVEIDYSIIEHFSQHLYGSPNKAIEELVSNGFDAGALRTYVYVPGALIDDSIVVWDNGASMGTDDLHKLWWIAQSPKVEAGRETQVADENGQKRERLMVGKFGIGKLASCVVGHRITHLCRQGDRFLRISIDYRDVPHLRADEKRRPYAAAIVALSHDEARMYVQSLFRPAAQPEVLNTLWASEHWTFAVIDHLKPEAHLTEGRLRWVIGNGMPLRPDFRVWVNDVEVESKLEKGASTSWDLSEKKLQKQFAAEWLKAVHEGRVSGRYLFMDSAAGQFGTAVLQLPELGFVRAKSYLFDKTLKDESDDRRSYGYFLMVRDRLLNGDDDKGLLGLTDPSYGTFYRSQFVIHADGLDQDLLADRGRLRADTPRTAELAVLRDTLYHAARQELEDQDERRRQEQRSETLLPIESRDFFREPLTALVVRSGEPSQALFDPGTAARIEHAALAPEDPVAKVDYEAGGFIVNSAHPLRRTVANKVGDGRKAREILRTLDLFAVSERLFEGFLYDIGLSDEQITRILDWRDGLFRAMAQHFETAPMSEIIEDVWQTSYIGGKQFENALAKLFGLLGFETERDGASGKKDVLVIAPIGKGHYRFTVEAKGSRGPIENDAAEISSAAAHRDEVKGGAQHAVVVAREFKGFERDPIAHPAILKECTSTGGVSIVDVKTLVALCNAVHTYYYPLDDVLSILSTIESPAEKMARVRQLQEPTDNFDYHGVLKEIWKRQQEESKGDLVAYRTLWQVGPDRWGLPEFDDFKRRLIALETLSGSLLTVSEAEQAVTLHQSPDIVAERIQQAVELRRLPKGSDDEK